MRRPRGPGGRFLTAEEIAAQKLTQGEGDDGLVHLDHEEEDTSHPPHVMFDESPPIPRDTYHDSGSLANALSLNPPLHYNKPPSTLHSPYSSLPQMHIPPQQPRMHYSNPMYPSDDSMDESEMRRRTEEMIHYNATGSSG